MKTFTLLPSRKNQDNRNLCICIITAKKDSRGSIRFCMGRTPALCSHWPCSRYHSALEHCVCLVDPSCLTLCDPLDYSPPGSSVQRILQARVLERVAIPFFRESSWPRGRTQVSCTAGRSFTVWTTIEAPSSLLCYSSCWWELTWDWPWGELLSHQHNSLLQIIPSSPPSPSLTRYPHHSSEWLFQFLKHYPGGDREPVVETASQAPGESISVFYLTSNCSECHNPLISFN